MALESPHLRSIVAAIGLANHVPDCSLQELSTIARHAGLSTGSRRLKDQTAGHRPLAILVNKVDSLVKSLGGLGKVLGICAWPAA